MNQPSLFDTEDVGSAAPAESSVPKADLTGPLAARMRPRTLDEYAGQEQVIGPGSLLRRAVEEDRLSSIILWGPPGCGKSTLALLVAGYTQAHFETFSAVLSGIPEVRKALEAARTRKRVSRKRTILFIDEIHRFNRGQQDAFLPYVEDGTIVLIGATTENPFFEINHPLLSRSQVFRLERLPDHAVDALIIRAVTDPDRGLGALRVELSDAGRRRLVELAGGDARRALTVLEAAALGAEPDPNGARFLGPEQVLAAAQAPLLGYDRQGDQHYDHVSAFIKSLRGSDPDATVYWLHRMLAAGEDPRFLCRRMLVHAAEDVGMADPMALVVAASAAQALEWVGLPEAKIPMTQAALYLATAPKSNSVIGAMGAAQALLSAGAPPPVPLHLRDAHYRSAARLGHGKDYRYPHDYPDGFVRQTYLPDGLSRETVYRPTDHGFEAEISRRLRNWWGLPADGETTADDLPDPGPSSPDPPA